MSILELKQKLSDYYTGKLDKQIKLKREELKYPPIDIDDVLIKVQTSNLNNSPVEREVLNLMENKELDDLIRRKGCIEKFIRNQTEEDRMLMYYVYKSKYSRVKISTEMYMTRKTVYNRERSLVIELGKYLAWEV